MTGSQLSGLGRQDAIHVSSPASGTRSSETGKWDGSCQSLPRIPSDTVDGCEILHQLIDGKHPTIYRVSTILLVVQDFSHQYHCQASSSQHFSSPKSVMRQR